MTGNTSSELGVDGKVVIVMKTALGIGEAIAEPSPTRVIRVDSVSDSVELVVQA